MNKNVSVALLGLGVSVAVLGGCSGPQIGTPETTTQEQAASMPAETTPSVALAGVTFHNMSDEAALQDVLKQLTEAGIPSANIDAFAEQVRTFNSAIPAHSLTSGDAALADVIEQEPPRLQDLERTPRLTNCRITVFTLMQDNITVGNTKDADVSQLFMDTEEIEKEPALFGGNRAKFDAYFGWIPTTNDKAAAQRTQDIQNYLSEREIAFAPGAASVVSVYVHDTLDNPAHSFIGHTGVLVETADGLLFVEKLAFDAPYRAIQFSDREQLHAYLAALYDHGSELEYGSPIIFEDAKPL